VHQGTPTSNSSLSGISKGHSAIIHRTVRCTPDMSGAPRKSGLRNSPASGFYCSCSAKNSPDCPVCTGLSGASSGQRLLRANGHLQAHLMRARSAQSSGTREQAHRTLNSTCPVCTGHQGGPRSQKLQRSESNGTGDVAGAPDCPVCTGLSGAPSNRQPPPTVMFGGWGYKYPNHPTIHGIQVFQLPTTIQELAFIAKHTKRDQILSQLHTKP
jgi:hypothetical protein